MKSVWLGRATVAALLLLGLIPFIHKGTGGTSELPVYTLAGERMLAGDEIYLTSDGKPFTYPPFFAVPFVISPEVPMDPPRATAPIIGWYIITAAALVLVFVVVHQSLVSGSSLSLWWFYFLTLLLSGRYIASVFGNQSHDLLVFLPIALGLQALIAGRDHRAAIWLALAASFKATPLLFLAYFFLQRRWLALLTMIVAVTLLTLLPDLVLARTDGQLWVWAWLKTFVLKLTPGGPADTGPWLAGSILNQSLGGTLHRIVPATWPGSILIPVAQLAVLVFVCAALWQRHTERHLVIAQVSVVVCGMVLLSPMSSKAHFCVLLLPVALSVWMALEHRSKAAIATLAFVFVVGTLTSKDIVGRELGNQILHFGTATWLTVALLTVSAWTSICKPFSGKTSANTIDTENSD